MTKVERSAHFLGQFAESGASREAPAPMQERSRKTANLFVNAALKALQHKTYAELSVSELARDAGRSVGVFYQRFGSKDEFLSILLTAYFERILTAMNAVPQDASVRDVYWAYLTVVYENALENRNLWHAALTRSTTDPTFWEIFGTYRTQIAQIVRERIHIAMKRPLTSEEARRYRIGFQIFRSVINNQIINAPGPLALEDTDLLEELGGVVMEVARVPMP